MILRPGGVGDRVGDEEQSVTEPCGAADLEEDLEECRKCPGSLPCPMRSTDINIEKRKPFHFNKVLMGLGVLLDKLATRHGKAVEEERGDDL